MVLIEKNAILDYISSLEKTITPMTYANTVAENIKNEILKQTSYIIDPEFVQAMIVQKGE